MCGDFVSHHWQTEDAILTHYKLAFSQLLRMHALVEHGA
jgi:hypothetical protein